jgi:Polyketide cyclase / dehydrase and lipid transport
MTEPRRVSLAGALHVPLVPSHAWHLFTPRGECVWVEDWDPRFLVDVVDDSEPGTVFTTHHGARYMVWTVVGRDPGRAIEYARVAIDDHAGMVIVTCAPGPGGGTTVAVRYELTALKPGANTGLDEFAAGYQGLLEHWQDSIEAALARAEHSPGIDNQDSPGPRPTST